MDVRLAPGYIPAGHEEEDQKSEGEKNSGVCWKEENIILKHGGFLKEHRRQTHRSLKLQD